MDYQKIFYKRRHLEVDIYEGVFIDGVHQEEDVYVLVVYKDKMIFKMCKHLKKSDWVM